VSSCFTDVIFSLLFFNVYNSISETRQWLTVNYRPFVMEI